MYSVVCILILGWTIAGSTLNEVQDIGEAGSQKDNTGVQMEVEPQPLDLPQLRKQCQIIIDTMVLREEDSNLEKAKALATTQTQSRTVCEHTKAALNTTARELSALQMQNKTAHSTIKELREKLKLSSKTNNKVQPLKTEPAASEVGKGMPDDAEEVHAVQYTLAMYSMHVHNSCTSR